jgi:uncharacterized protein (DUF58 family)
MIETTTWRTRCERWLTHDYVPGANRYVYWMKTPLGVLALASAASLACGFCVAPQGFVLTGVSATIIGLGIVWPWLAMRGIRAELTFHRPRTREGQSVPVRLIVRNRWPLPIWGLAVQGGFDGDSNADKTTIAFALARVAGWSTATFEWDFTPDHRGEVPRTTPRIGSAFPFGIWQCSRPVETTATLLVWPRSFPLVQMPLLEGEHNHWSMPSDRFAGFAGDRIGVRPYRQGDSLRHVHWVLSARHDRLIVCERQGSAQAAAYVKVDDRRSHHFTRGDQCSWEWALRVAASVVNSLWEQGVDVRLAVGATSIVPSRCSRDATELLDALARATLTDATPTAAALTRPRLTEPNLTFAIATDRNRDALPSSGRVRRIVLSDRGAGSPSDKDGWLVLDDWDDLASQLSERWRMRSLGVWHAA